MKTITYDETKWKLVPKEILDRFPEINPSNYDHDDACALNDWGVEVVSAAAPTPPADGQPRDVSVDVSNAHAIADFVNNSDPDAGPIEALHECIDTLAAQISIKAQQWEGVEDSFFSPENLIGLSKDELIRQLQWALDYWMPSIAGDETPDGRRCEHDAYLLYGMKTPVGREDENAPTYWEKQQPDTQAIRDAADEIERLQSEHGHTREALKWTAAALSAVVKIYRIPETDVFQTDDGSRQKTVGELLDMADAALGRKNK